MLIIFREVCLSGLVGNMDMPCSALGVCGCHWGGFVSDLCGLLRVFRSVLCVMFGSAECICMYECMFVCNVYSEH